MNCKIKCFFRETVFSAVNVIYFGSQVWWDMPHILALRAEAEGLQQVGGQSRLPKSVQGQSAPHRETWVSKKLTDNNLLDNNLFCTFKISYKIYSGLPKINFRLNQINT